MSGVPEAGPSGHTYLDFNAPLSDRRAAALVAGLGPLTGARVLDLGCGWAELLLRVLATEPTASGVGVDHDAEAIERAQANARQRGLDTRLDLRIADIARDLTVADVVTTIGTSHAWGGTVAMLTALRSHVSDGGIALVGDGIWSEPPTDAALAALEATPGDFLTFATFVDASMAAGFRVLAAAEADLDEWDDFESRWCDGRERWLLDNPSAPEADEVRAVVDRHRAGWLHGYRGVLGFAYVTLAAPPRRTRAS